jgi:predicted ester cyclase
MKRNFREFWPPRYRLTKHKGEVVMEQIIQLQRATIEEHVRQENAHNWPKVYETFVQDENSFYDVVPFHTHFSGMTGVKDFYRAADAAFPDFLLDVWAEYHLLGSSIVEVTLSGTHKGDWGGVPGTGRRVKFHIMALFLFGKGRDAGKIVAERIYFDNDTVLKQIRGVMDASTVPDFVQQVR